jgi:hypothetical protein
VRCALPQPRTVLGHCPDFIVVGPCYCMDDLTMVLHSALAVLHAGNGDMRPVLCGAGKVAVYG